MIKDEKIVIMSDAIIPFFFPQEWAINMAGCYSIEDPKLNDIVVIEFPAKPENNELEVTWKIRIVLGLPNDLFVATKQLMGNLYELKKNTISFVSPMQQKYLFTFEDLMQLGFDSKLTRRCRDNEYFVWTAKVTPYNNFYKGGFVHKKSIISKVVKPVHDDLIFNDSNNSKETNTAYFL